MSVTPTPKQIEVISSKANLVVIGRPGSGKTTAALFKAIEYLREPDLEEYQKVLFLSFSNAAVGRILDVFKDAPHLTRKVRSRLKIKTFHSFCVEILRSHSHLNGNSHPFKILSSNDQRCLERRLIEEKGVSKDLAMVRVVGLERSEGKVSFDRFATITNEILQNFPKLALAYSGMYPLIFVDEYQDTDHDQDEFIRSLACKSQLVCLGDDDQQIYDWRPGVSPRRLSDLEHKFGHTRVDLEVQNHRSPGSGVLEYARAVLRKQRIERPKSVTIERYSPRTGYDKKVRMALGRLFQEGRRSAWRNGNTAVMMFANQDVRRLSSFLFSGDSPIPHTVTMDLSEISASWRVVFSILECMVEDSVVIGFNQVLNSLIELEYNRHSGGSKSRKRQLRAWLENSKNGKPLRGFAKEFLQKIELLCSKWSGNPVEDLTDVVDMCSTCSGEYINSIRSAVQCLDPRNYIQSVINPLGEKFSNYGSYRNAILISESFLLKEQLSEPSRQNSGVVLMTLHKCKGKEFDSVLIIDPPMQNRLVHRGEPDGNGEYPKSRRLLHTAISRARHRVFILTPAHDPCPILS